jgi:hypothetical protein
MPLLTFSSSNFPFTAFTKIYSADVDSCFTDIRSRFNWSGGTDATTGLDDSNIQSNTVASGGLTRSTKLKAGTANYVVINDSSGNMSEEAQLAPSRGGTGSNLTITASDAGKALIVNAGGTSISLAATSSAPLNIFNFYTFS